MYMAILLYSSLCPKESLLSPLLCQIILATRLCRNALPATHASCNLRNKGFPTSLISFHHARIEDHEAATASIRASEHNLKYSLLEGCMKGMRPQWSQVWKSRFLSMRMKRLFKPASWRAPTDQGLHRHPLRIHTPPPLPPSVLEGNRRECTWQDHRGVWVLIVRRLHSWNSAFAGDGKVYGQFLAV